MNWSTLDAQLKLLIERAVHGLAQHREQVILVGGLVKYFYEYHEQFSVPAAPLRATVDLDIALTPMALANGQQVHQELLDAQLVPYFVLDTEGRPIEQRYHLAEDGTHQAMPTCLEMVAPQPPPRRRQPLPRPSALSPALLKYVELLLRDPIAVDIPELGRIQLPHPLSYVMQKTLIRSHRRESAKQASDQADIVYVCWGFREAWSTWITVLHGWVTTDRSIARHWRQTIKIWQTLYANPGAQGSQEVAHIYSSLGRHIDPRVIARVMQEFIEEMSS